MLVFLILGEFQKRIDLWGNSDQKKRIYGETLMILIHGTS